MKSLFVIEDNIEDNLSKHQAMVLGNKLHHRFSFPTKDSLELFGMIIDQDLNFDKHIINICKKVNDQFNVMQRFSNLVSKHTMLSLYRNFIVPPGAHIRGGGVWGGANPPLASECDLKSVPFFL